MADKRQPCIGIWWNNGATLVALVHPPEENSSGTELIDSNLAHADEWERVAVQLGVDPAEEYFSVPRGRVLVRRSTGEGILYHGGDLSPVRLQQIAERFQLPRWEPRLDDHYRVAPASELFEDL